MVEFRTEAPGQSKDESGNAVDGLLDEYIQEAKKDSNLQLRLLNMAQKNGIDPVLLSPLTDISSDELEALQQQQAQQQQAQQQQTQQQQPQMPQGDTETDGSSEEINAEEVLGFLGEIMDYTEEEMTLKELQEWGEKNKDLVDTAIDLHL